MKGLPERVCILTDFDNASFSIVSDHYAKTFQEMGLKVHHLPYPISESEADSIRREYSGTVFFHNTNGRKFRALNGETNIAWVLHEWSRYPSEWIPYLESFHEIWVTTTHVSELLKASGVKCSVYCIPPALDLDLGVVKQNYKKSDTFRFLFVGEWHFRKGLHLLFEAWKLAFPEPGTAFLTVKTSSTCPFSALRSDVQISKEKLSNVQLRELYLEHDCYVSSSLGEGLGLPIAEAILVGIPICTNYWGGHRNLLKRGCFFEIPHREILQPYCSIPELYALDQTCCFSDPRDIGRLLVQVTNSAEAARKHMVEEARKHLLKNYGFDAVQARIMEQIANDRPKAETGNVG